MGAHLDVCCDICGDEGVPEAIATCSRCKVSREHVYCMLVCRKEVPRDWCCENCGRLANLHRDHAQPNKKTAIEREKKIITAKVKPLSPEEVIKLSSGSKFSPVKNNARTNTVPIMKNKVAFSPEKSKAVPSFAVRANPSLVPLKQMDPPRHGTPRINNAKYRHQQFVKEPRESLASESVSRKVSFQPLVKEHKLENFQQKQAMDAPKDIASTIMAAPKDIASTKMAASMAEKDTIRTPPVGESITKDGQRVLESESLASESVSRKVTFHPSVKEHKVEIFQQKPALNAPKDVASTIMAAPKDIASTNMAAPKDIVFPKMAASMAEKDTIRTPSVGESTTKDGQLALISGGAASPDTVYGPIPCHFWMGSFRVTHNAKFVEDQIQAHHPSRVHKMVYQLSKKMPAVLNFELVDRKGIFVKMFPDYLPDLKDIALYFKPSNGKRSRNFISMLEHLQAKDLALRMVIDGTELLVFTSKALHADCQKWEGSYFLWGLFRRKKVRKPAAAGPPLDLYAANYTQEDDDGVDMEVDMMAGLDVGRKDIVAPRPRLLLPPSTPAAVKTEQQFYDIPPGFNCSS